MKTYCATLLSGLLLVAQFFALTSTAPIVSAQKLPACCLAAEAVHCTAKCCMASTPTPAAPISPAPVPSTTTGTAFEIAALLATEWTLPRSATRLVDLQDRAEIADAARDVPLFLRHAALLI